MVANPSHSSSHVSATGNISSATPDTTLREILHQTRAASVELARASTTAKNTALAAIAESLADHSAQILAANQTDLSAAESNQLPKALINRLKLDANKVAGMIAGVKDVMGLADPIGVRQIHRELDQGLILERRTCPLGVVGVIFEARPDAVPQIVSLGIKSGNGVVLKGGSEAINSCAAIMTAIHAALNATNDATHIAPTTMQLLTTRAETLALLGMDGLIDLIIPRGSNQFVQYIQQNTHIPVLGHAEGICHLYIDQYADPAKAIAITIDSKTQYPAACNAIETLLIHEAVAETLLPEIAQALQNKSVSLRGCERTQQILSSSNLDLEISPANDSDWSTEYSDLILSIKVVDSVSAAMVHINTYGSRHTEAIVTEDSTVAEIFLQDVDAAGVYHNCSTRFADGFRYGFGAEVGISTQKLPPRGPVGVEGLITYKYRLVGQGQVVADYGTNGKSFTHRDLSDHP
ncbi:MAG: glutamate-5-semialdehyde dehydrogenase [Pseudanabaenaceae cyanobacterium]